MKKILLCLALLLVSFANYAQLNIGQSKKQVVKEAVKSEKRLKKLTKKDIPVPLGFIWLKDSLYMSANEVTLREWSEYLYSKKMFESEADYDTLKFYAANVKDIYGTRDLSRYNRVVSLSVLLNSILFSDKINYPVVNVNPKEAEELCKYLENYLSKRVFPTDSLKTHWYFSHWAKLYPNYKFKIKIEIPEVRDYILIDSLCGIKSTYKIVPSSNPNGINVQLLDYEFQDCLNINGISNNAWELIKLDGVYYQLMNKNNDTYILTKYSDPNFDTSFRYKCTLSLIKK